MNITSDQEGYNINYKISLILHAFRLVAIHDLLEDRRISDGTVNFFTSSFKTNRSDVVVHLFSNGIQMTSKCGRNISDGNMDSTC